MCGRYTHRYTWAELHRLMSLTTPQTSPLPFGESFNVAPTQQAPVVRQQGVERRADMLRWGLIPFWAEDASIGNSLINARMETVGVKPAFREAFRARRCLVPASGFFEWKKLDTPGGARKQPYYITAAGGEPLAFAGLWERWRPRENSPGPVESFTIITTPPNEMMANLHDRMPAIIAPEDFGRWLDPGTPREEVERLLRPYPSELMLARAVSTRVNNPKNNDAGCLEPAGQP